MSAPEGLPPRFDLLDAQRLGDPYPVYARLRAAAAVCRAGPATWAVTRHAEVAALLRDPRLGHASEEGFDRPIAGTAARQDRPTGPVDVLPGLVSGLDPPAHTAVRRLLRHALAGDLVGRLEARLTARADELAREAAERGRVDAVADLALPLQTFVASELLGVPHGDRDEVGRNAIALGRAIILVPFARDPQAGAAEAAWLRGYVAGLVAERRRRPGTDVVSRLLAARHAGEGLGDGELVDNAVFLFFAGYETMIHTIAGGCANLLRFPAEVRRLREDPSLLPPAVEEVLRYDPPLQWISRMTAAPVEVGGRRIRAGRFLLLLLASANRDPEEFRDPDRLDVTRSPNRHLSFGGGVHRCLGVELARREAVAVFGRLLGRSRRFDLDGEPEVDPHPNVRSYRRVPLVVEPA